MKSYRIPLRIRDEIKTDIVDADGVLVATVYPTPLHDTLGWEPASLPQAEAFARLIVQSVNSNPIITEALGRTNDQAFKVIAAALAVVGARYGAGGWDALKNAIGELEDIVGRPPEGSG